MASHPTSPAPSSTRCRYPEPVKSATATRRPGLRATLSEALARRAREWSRRRTGSDGATIDLVRRRVYIVPTALGFTYGAMLFAMLLAGLNYGNNLALILTFVLTATGWVAMHECHRNVADLRIVCEPPRAPFAGARAAFRYRLCDLAGRARYDVCLSSRGATPYTACVVAGGTNEVTLEVPTRVRGEVAMTRLKVESRFPLGLCRAWSWLHVEQRCTVYPRPAAVARVPDARDDHDGGARASARQGDDDWSGLRSYRRGDPVRRLAWKAYARGGELLVKEMDREAATPLVFDWDTLAELGTEERIARLTRLVVDAASRGDAYGLRLQDSLVAPGRGAVHRHRCLTLLSGYRLPPGPGNTDAG